jgi:uncharacterized protein
MRFRWMLLVVALVLAASAIAGVAQPRLGRSADAPAKTITVTGHGNVTTVPDRASFDFTVKSRAATATAAIGQNGDAAAALAAALKRAGVAADDLQTSQLSLSPRTNENGSEILGYEASTTISAKTSIAKAGSVVDAAVGAGAGSVSGPNLSRSDQDALYRDALKRAVADAHAKAEALAAAGGLTLGGAQSLVEGSIATPLPIAAQKLDFAPTIEPGTQTVDATVTVTYAAG